MLRDIQDEIIRIKKDKRICILAHSYLSEDILEVADFTGDSYALSKNAASADCDTILMCGVRFMAETAKLLSPDKKVILANPLAGCPMAEQFTKEDILELKRSKYPDHAVVAYINTTADLKTVCDVCVTSSSALKIVSSMPDKKILFIPDVNLGSYIKKMCPDKEIALVNGGCPIHAQITAYDVDIARKAFPEALLLVHPECRNEVVERADYVGSTTGIMRFAMRSDNKEFIIGTENSIVQHLQIAAPDKFFYPLSKKMLCVNMKTVTISDVYNAVSGKTGEEIIIPENVANKAVKCIDRMIELGG